MKDIYNISANEVKCSGNKKKMLGKVMTPKSKYKTVRYIKFGANTLVGQFRVFFWKAFFPQGKSSM